MVNILPWAIGFILLNGITYLISRCSNPRYAKEPNKYYDLKMFFKHYEYNKDTEQNEPDNYMIFLLHNKKAKPLLDKLCQIEGIYKFADDFLNLYMITTLFGGIFGIAYILSHIDWRHIVLLQLLMPTPLAILLGISILIIGLVISNREYDKVAKQHTKLIRKIEKVGKTYYND